MTATAAQISQVRRMTAEPTTSPYTDALIQGFIEAHPLMDELGRAPYYWQANGSSAPTKTANTDWIVTYDLNAAAADIWDEKAASVAALFDFHADGGVYTRSQTYEQARKMALFYRSRASIKLVKMRPAPIQNNRETEWVGNLGEDD